jgi:Do/DeqQ family serine protease
MSSENGRSYWGFIAVIAAALLLIGALVRAKIPVQGKGGSGAKLNITVASDLAPLSLEQFKNGYSAAVDPALPAVVNISSTRVVKRQAVPSDEFNSPLFRQFFGEHFGPPSEAPRTEREHSLGSGVIVDPNGYILTNNHVVEDGSDIEVFTQERKEYKATIVGTDPRTDIAVLKIDATHLPVLKFGDSSKLNVGDLVFAIGDPFGVGETATTGIVSATGRGFGGAIEHYENFIQTDAAVNPGNSGGALVELHGDLIGINTAIISGGGGGNEGVGFAIPINMVRNVMEQIVEHGKVVRGYMGVSIQEVNPDLAKAFGLPHGGGALVGDLSPSSPAAKAGIQRGDVVLELNGTPVTSPDDLSVRISQLQPGTVADLEISRNGQTMDVKVTLGEYPEEEANKSQQGREIPEAVLKGMQLQDLTPQIAQELKVPASTIGVVVAQADPSSEAAAAGIERGDIIQEVNHKPVHNLSEYRQEIAASGNQPVLLLINRGGTTHFVVIQPQ